MSSTPSSATYPSFWSLPFKAFASGTSLAKAREWYDAPGNEDTFAAQRCSREPPAVALERKRCATCGKDEAHLFCTVCHHWFHNNPKFLPSAESKFVAVPTAKRTATGEPVYMYAENNCALAWHAQAREEAVKGMRPGVIAQMTLSRYNAPAAASEEEGASNAGDQDDGNADRAADLPQDVAVDLQQQNAADDSSFTTSSASSTVN